MSRASTAFSGRVKADASGTSARAPATRRAPGRARGAAGGAGGSEVIAIERALTGPIDPAAIARRIVDPDSFHWECPASGEWIVAGGIAHEVCADGRGRFARASRALRSLSGDRFLAVGGFAFAGGRSADGAGRATDDARGPASSLSLVIPRWAIQRGRAGTVARLFVVRPVRDARRDTASGRRASRPVGRPERLWQMSSIRTAAALRECLERALGDLLGVLLGDAPGAETAVRLPTRIVARPVGGRESWRRQVEGTLRDLGRGRLEKLVLARAVEVEADAPLDPLTVLSRLRRSCPLATVFAVRRGGWSFVGASPERLARVEGRTVRTSAIAGTVPLGSSPAETRQLASALRRSVKDRREQSIVVGDLEARLRPLCVSLSPASRPAVVVAGNVQHLATELRGRLHAGLGLVDVLEALHPTPALGGAPREAALRILLRREGLDRGWYGGGVGWTDGGEGEMVVGIRAATLTAGRARLCAGAGIVAGSTWAAELAETRLKLAPLLEAVLEV